MVARGRHVLITGASTGIGRACALQLARQGFSVWAGIRTAEEAKSVEQAAAGTPIPIRCIQLDVTNLPSIHAAEEEIRSHAGENGLGGLVNNAGICIVGPVEFISLDAWRQQLDVNLFGVIAVTQTMLPLLRVHNARCAKPGSRIVNMGSITGEISTPLFGAYSASKFALRAVNDALRLELRPEGIRVCLIVPGTIQSEIWRKEKECVDAIAPGSPARQHYGALIDHVAGYVFSCAEKALPAQRVADAVQQCFTSARPRIQYRVGWEAQVGSRAKKVTPDRLFDFLLARKLGVPETSGPASIISKPSKNSPILEA
ncbi:MAG TPA: SDR family oxidoreductase [Tepidisphaeraceae bacterium]|nr:SDR family oxidoreductase [Tepidisphaeraceae bacterium]